MLWTVDLWFPFVLVPFLLHIFFSPAINGNQAILDLLLTGEAIAVVASSSFEWHVTKSISTRLASPR
jgi:hypothetical protein